MSLPLVADDREPSTIAQSLGISQARLPYGDYQFYGAGGIKVLIERKEISDCLNSLSDRSLQVQLHNMRNLPNTISILLIEGYWGCSRDFHIKHRAGKKLRTSGWRYDAFMHHLLTFQDEGVRLIFTPNQSTTIFELEKLYHYYQQTEHKSLNARPKPSWAATNTRGKQIYLLSALPGIGPELAGRILEKYAPMDVLYNPHLLEEIEGIGKHKVSEIEKVVGLA